MMVSLVRERAVREARKKNTPRKIEKKNTLL